MRHSIALFLVSLSLSLFACGGDDDSSGDSPPRNDGSPTATDGSPTADAPSGGDAGGDPAIAGQVDCGTFNCTLPEGCCQPFSGDSTCEIDGECSGFLTLCDQRADCSGDDYCCLDITGKASCQPASSDGCQASLCVTDDDCPVDGDICCSDGDGSSGICDADCM